MDIQNMSRNYPKEIMDLLVREIPNSQTQGSEAWHEARKGNITGSQLSKVVPMRPYRGAWSAPSQSASYLEEKVMELTSGCVEEVPDNQYMKWGREHEKDARAFMEDYMQTKVYETGAIAMPWSDRVVISPDGVGIDSDGVPFIFEAKCPKTKTHTRYCMAKTPKPPNDYLLQMHGEMMVTGAEYGMYLSYDPRAKGMEVLPVRVEKDEELCSRIEVWCKKFLKKIDLGVAQCKSNATSIEEFYKTKGE